MNSGYAMKFLVIHYNYHLWITHADFSAGTCQQLCLFNQIKIILKKFKNILSDVSIAIRLNLVLQLKFIIDYMVYVYLYLKNECKTWNIEQNCYFLLYLKLKWSKCS